MPLHHAACIGNLELCELLLGFGAEINAPDGIGQFSLQIAAKHAHTGVYFCVVGTAKTSLVITIGPSPLHRGETTSTIMFGQRVSTKYLSIFMCSMFDKLGPVLVSAIIISYKCDELSSQLAYSFGHVLHASFMIFLTFMCGIGIMSVLLVELIVSVVVLCEMIQDMMN